MINFVDSTQAGARQVTPQDLDDAFAAMLQLAGGTMTGPLLLSEDPTDPTEAANKRYVDAKLTGSTGATGATGSTPTDLTGVNNAIAAEVVARATAINAAIAKLVLSQAAFYPDPAFLDPQGVVDSTVGLQRSIDAAAAAGGGIVIWPGGRFKITSTLTNTTSGVRIIGAGHGAFHDSGALVQANTLLLWGGTVNGTMMAVGPVQAATSQKLTGVDVIGVAFQGTPDLVTAGADYGLILTSVQHSNFDIYTVEFGIAAAAFTVGGSLAEAGNCEGNTMSLRFRQINQVGTALQLSGSAVGNTCYNEFPIVYGYISKGIGIDFQDSDNNRVGRAWIDRVVGGTGRTIYFRSDSVFGNNGHCARVNTIDDLSQSVHSGEIYAEGFERSGTTVASYGNRILSFDQANTLIKVVTGTGASIFWSYNTSPIGLRESIIGEFDGHYQLTTGLIEFWSSTPILGAGTTSTFTMGFGVSRILDVSAQILGNESVPGSPSCFNYTASLRADGAANKFDLYAPASGYYTYRGKALAPL